MVEVEVYNGRAKRVNSKSNRLSNKRETPILPESGGRAADKGVYLRQDAKVSTRCSSARSRAEGVTIARSEMTSLRPAWMA